MKLPRPFKALGKWLRERSELRRQIDGAQARLSIHHELGTLKEIAVRGFKETGYYENRLRDLRQIERARAEMSKLLVPASMHLSHLLPNAAGTPTQSHHLSLHGTIAYYIGKHPEYGQEEPLPFVRVYSREKNIGQAWLAWDTNTIKVEIRGKKAVKKLGVKYVEIPSSENFKRHAARFYEATERYEKLRFNYYGKYCYHR